MFTLLFWKAATERAVKSAAQAVVLFWAIGDGLLNAWTADWQGAAGVAVGGAVLSYLTSIISGVVGERGTPSLGPETLPKALDGGLVFDSRTAYSSEDPGSGGVGFYGEGQGPGGGG